MKLSSLLKNIRFQKIQGTLRKEIAGIFDHSGKCCPDGLFVAVHGRKQDGHLYLEEAVRKGANVCIVERLPGISYQKPNNVTLILVADTRKALASIAASFYPIDFLRMKLIGITGTKGKTSVAYMIREGFLRSDIPVGMIGSNGAYINQEYIETENTTPGVLTLRKLLHRMDQNHCSYVILEVSSQSVMQSRVYGLPFQIGVFTNFAVDHIGPGEHDSLDEYWYWKCRFLKQAECKIINADLLDQKHLAAEQKGKVLTFGLDKECDLQIGMTMRKRSKNAFWIEAVFSQVDGDERILLPFPFHFQVANAAAASLVLKQCGVNRQVVRDALMKVRIPGRCEWVYNEHSRYIMVDYAHNAYSMKSLLSEFREFAGLTILSLFGCGGGRSHDRRQEMGRVSGMYSDLTIITEDNSREESPEKIMEEIRQGVAENHGEYILCKDREKAIRLACTYLKEHTLLLLLGKGRENYIETAEGKIPYSDYETIQRIQREGGICL